jgi:hypothetical protein
MQCPTRHALVPVLLHRPPQGLFLAPQTTGEALKGGRLVAEVRQAGLLRGRPHAALSRLPRQPAARSLRVPSHPPPSCAERGVGLLDASTHARTVPGGTATVCASPAPQLLHREGYKVIPAPGVPEVTARASALNFRQLCPQHR